MKLFLHIEEGYEVKKVEVPWTNFASSLGSDVMGTIIHQNSEESIIDIVSQLCISAEKILILMEITTTSYSIDKSLRKMIDDNIESVEKILIKYQTDALPKVDLQNLNVVFIKDDQQLKDLITAFAKGN